LLWPEHLPKNVRSRHKYENTDEKTVRKQTRIRVNEEATHMKTSPKSTSVNEAFAPVDDEKKSEYGPPEGVGGRLCRHTPSDPAVVLNVELPKVVSTITPAAAKPQILAD
jgi:hypothetical protein